MTFRVDLGQKDGINIFLVIVRDQININFAPNTPEDEHTAYQMRSDFGHLLGHFNMRFRSDMVRGEDSEHVKRHHGVHEETTVPHQHLSFDRDVNPTILAEFFEGLLKAQKEHKLDKQYQFFKEDTATDIMQAFTQFWKEFSGSKLEKECLHDRRLNRSEALSLAKHASKPLAGTLSPSDLSELNGLGVEVTKPVRTFVDPGVSLSLLLNALFFGKSNSSTIFFPQQQAMGSSLASAAVTKKQEEQAENKFTLSL